ncbi:hypothetical protein Nepgr_000023 [Nepenthes gracilis]|uniref:Uncharacterized protein n=1 Tax=Nepenthes gracilis TaxID=150966 RepID=A0AAD3P2H3_NEPGR|nr:hypothetical protein Nepgr_000023 [Nepenthes gracilis]
MGLTRLGPDHKKANHDPQGYSTISKEYRQEIGALQRKKREIFPTPCPTMNSSEHARRKETNLESSWPHQKETILHNWATSINLPKGRPAADHMDDHSFQRRRIAIFTIKKALDSPSRACFD